MNTLDTWSKADAEAAAEIGFKIASGEDRTFLAPILPCIIPGLDMIPTEADLVRHLRDRWIGAGCAVSAKALAVSGHGLISQPAWELASYILNHSVIYDDFSKVALAQIARARVKHGEEDRSWEIMVVQGSVCWPGACYYLREVPLAGWAEAGPSPKVEQVFNQDVRAEAAAFILDSFADVIREWTTGLATKDTAERFYRITVGPGSKDVRIRDETGQPVRFKVQQKDGGKQEYRLPR